MEPLWTQKYILYQVLNELNDWDLGQVFQINKKFHQVQHRSDFWKYRIVVLFGVQGIENFDNQDGLQYYLETRQHFLTNIGFVTPGGKNIKTNSDLVFAIKHAIYVSVDIIQSYAPTWVIDWLPNKRYGYYPSPTIATFLVNTYTAETIKNHFLDILTLLTTFGIHIDFRDVKAGCNTTAQLLMFLERNYVIPPEVVYHIITAEKTYDQMDKFEIYGYHSKFLIHSSLLTKTKISDDYKINLLEELLEAPVGLKQNVIFFEFPKGETDDNALKLCQLLCKCKLPITLNLLADAGEKGLCQTYNYLTTLFTKSNVCPKNLPPLSFLAQCEQAIANKKIS